MNGDRMKATAAALAVVAGLSWQAQAESLAVRCEGTKVTTERKEPDRLKEMFPKQSVGEEDKGTKDARSEDRASTDVIVADHLVYAFDAEFETGFTTDILIRFGRFPQNPEITAFFLESFSGEINRVAGTLEATQLKYKKNGWLYLEIKYSLNCKKLERKF
jgi:hypothetical protein